MFNLNQPERNTKRPEPPTTDSIMRKQKARETAMTNTAHDDLCEGCLTQHVYRPSRVDTVIASLPAIWMVTECV